MISISNLDLLFLGITIGSIAVLGFSVFFSNKNSTTNKSFLFFALVTIFWGIVNYLNYRVDSPILILWLLRLVIASAVWHAFSFFQLFYVFPEEKIKFPKWYKFILLPLVALSSLINLTPLSFSGIEKLGAIGEVSTVTKGPGMALFLAVVMFCIAGGLFLLIKKLIKTKDIEKRQFRMVFIGTFITFALLFTFNFFLPALFDNVIFIPFGAIFILPFILFFYYTIARHKLFHVRVVGTAVLVFFLSIVSFVEVIRADNLWLMLYRSGVMALVLVFGILLIRGALKEIERREQIARAYAIEKKAKEDTERAYEKEKEYNEKLQELDKMKNQFLISVQHDLKTPLTSIMWYSDLLLQGQFGKLNKKTTEVIKKFQILSQDNIKKVKNFLDASQFQLGKAVVKLEPNVPLKGILEEIVNEFKFRAEAAGIYVKFEESGNVPLVSADREKLKGAIYNIVDNGTKYTKEGGVTISVLENNGKAIIKVQDTGIGMSPDTLKKLFGEMFERSEEAKKTFTMGSGVGLYMANQIIKMHNGTVRVESEGEGKGSTFYIELPVK